VKAVAYPTDEEAIFEAAKIFLQCEGWLIAPESSYAVRAAIDEALKNEKTEQEKVICMNISGHGFLDIPAYKEKISVLS
jgi:tryptophan synthase beta chain